MVMDQNVAGTSGWWMCSLYGRHGLAPANRLQLLTQIGATAGSPGQMPEKNKLIDAKTDDCTQNIYQIPSVPRPSSSSTYERMDMIYKVPSNPATPTHRHSTEGPEVNVVLLLINYTYKNCPLIEFEIWAALCVCVCLFVFLCPCEFFPAACMNWTGLPVLNVQYYGVMGSKVD